eukprot:IDg22320t1
MGPEGPHFASGSFTDKTPPSFDGHCDYAAYRKDVAIWLLLTTLPAKKQGPALIGRLHGEAKSAAKTLSLEKISSEEGAKAILEHLDLSYSIDETDQLDIDLAAFFDYTWNGRTPIEHYIAGFNNRLDCISELKINSRLKGHLLLRQACLDVQSRNMIVGASSGKFEVKSISNSLRQAYRVQPESTQVTRPTATVRKPLKYPSRGQSIQARPRNNKSQRSQRRGDQVKSPTDTFFTYKSNSTSLALRAIVDSGACSSVVGKDTLDRAMKELEIRTLDDAPVSQGAHRFGDQPAEKRTLFAVKFPLHCTETNGSPDAATFNIKFD